ncbi:MAG: amidohydrolase [Parvularculaceae bacterium]|nr:amidohydrolase [Parvularculaceae bacterium]
MRKFLIIQICLMLAGCSAENAHDAPGAAVTAGADVILTNARVYTMGWPDPSVEGETNAAAPHDASGWRPDAGAVAMKDGKIIFVGDDAGALAFKSAETKLFDLAGATVTPGLVDSHTHVQELGAKLRSIDLTGVETEDAAVALVAARAEKTPAGEWIFGAGWDEGAWASHYPDKEKLSRAAPDNPVALDGLHGFAMWVNQAALDAGGVNADTPVPVGGEMRLDADGEPNGLFLNNATTIIDAIVPPPSRAEMKDRIVSGLTQMARDGYVSVHDAGVGADYQGALEELEAEGRLPIRFYSMLSLRDENLIKAHIAKGPDKDNDSFLVTRSVKAYYDGALGSRGARLLDDYSDMPGHRGVSGAGYGFNEALLSDAMKAGFQVGIHAIGDAGNRETLDLLERIEAAAPQTRANRNRIEHAQIVDPADMPRFAALDIIASMEPPHAVEDKTWAEERLGPDRVRNAYAWRSLRRAGARLVFNADNPGSDHSIFYGLHSAVTRRDKNLQPEGGWHSEESMTIDEAMRAYTAWPAYAGFREAETGVIEPGRWADLTIMDIDPFVTAESTPDDLLAGRVLMTIVDGKIVFDGR